MNKLHLPRTRIKLVVLNNKGMEVSLCVKYGVTLKGDEAPKGNERGNETSQKLGTV